MLLATGCSVVEAPKMNSPFRPIGTNGANCGHEQQRQQGLMVTNRLPPSFPSSFCRSVNDASKDTSATQQSFQGQQLQQSSGALMDSLSTWMGSMSFQENNNLSKEAKRSEPVYASMVSYYTPSYVSQPSQDHHGLLKRADVLPGCPLQWL